MERQSVMSICQDLNINKNDNSLIEYFLSFSWSTVMFYNIISVKYHHL